MTPDELRSPEPDQTKSDNGASEREEPALASPGVGEAWTPVTLSPVEKSRYHGRPSRVSAPRIAGLQQTWSDSAADEDDTRPVPAVSDDVFDQLGAMPSAPPAPTRRRRRNWAGVLLILTLIGAGIFFLALIAGIVGYIALAAQLPSPDDLRARQPNFASSQIYDRNGYLLHELIRSDAGKRTYVPINDVSVYLTQATVATEDRNFYTHGGFDPIALVRALYYALQEREIVSGASTITQQVARTILLPDEAAERTLKRKIKEIVLATELTRRYSKDEILEIYVNNNNYGNLAYGIDAAARTYFGTSAANLTLAQASFLAGIPQSPAIYDPYGGGRDLVLKRHKVVLSLMVEAGYISVDEAVTVAAEMDSYPFKPVYTDRIPYPHFVVYVTQWLERELGTDMLYTGRGLRIHTTIDPNLQRIAEEEVAQGVAEFKDRQVSNAALVALEPSSGHLLAMVGSADFYDEELGGQVNVTLRCRQPGSAIKPLTYLAAFEKGWTPATIVWDLPKVYTDTAGNTYRPVNYDGLFRGPTTVRRALANSLNIPAVKALEFVTVDGLLEVAERLGAASLVNPQTECPDYPYEIRPYYGLALTLGGAEMKPLELTSAYATLANGGLQMDPTPILWIEDQEGNILRDYRQRQGEQVIKPEYAYQITSILSDANARCEVFACDPTQSPRNKLELAGRPVAAKTGTTNDTRDAWTVGYTPDLVAGVWMGNNDNTPMDNVAGSAGAATVWQGFMQRAHESIPVRNFPRPAGIVEREVCELSGAQPSDVCPSRRVEVFSVESLPAKPEEDLFQSLELDANSNLLVNDFCRTSIVTKNAVYLNRVQDPDGQNWLKAWAAQNNFVIAPDRYCTVGDQAPVITISSPQPGQQVYDWVDVAGTVEMAEFDRYEVFYGVGFDPQGWEWLSGPHRAPVQNGLITSWDIPIQMSPGTYTIRVVAYNSPGARFEARVQVTVLAPTPTPTLTPSPTPTVTETPTPTPTPTYTLPVETPTPTPPLPPTDDRTPIPTLTPTESPTEFPSLTPTPTP